MKIWFDLCEPKSVIMLRPLYNRLIKDHNITITARDFDSTLHLLDKWDINYIPAGKYGGNTLLGKLEAYSKRLAELIRIIKKEKPHFLFSLASPEAGRISYGLQIPNIMFNDEPRSFGTCTTSFPYVDKLVVPKCIPLNWYLDYGLKKEQIIRFYGIDEVGWLSNFSPDECVLEKYNLKREKYLVCRTEPTKAVYLINKMKPHETLLTKIIPKLIVDENELKFLILPRNVDQFKHLNIFFQKEIKNDRVRLYKGLEKLDQIMYFSKMVLSGGGTMVRESALLGVPSIEFIPMETYPQERFLMENNFPLFHIKETNKIIKKVRDLKEKNLRINTREKIQSLENPIDVALEEFRKIISQ
jgi:predicted glycosyltransferase